MVSFKANTFSSTAFLLANGIYRCKSTAFAIHKVTLAMSKEKKDRKKKKKKKKKKAHAENISSNCPPESSPARENHTISKF